MRLSDFTEGFTRFSQSPISERHHVSPASIFEGPLLTLSAKYSYCYSTAVLASPARILFRHALAMASPRCRARIYAIEEGAASTTAVDYYITSAILHQLKMADDTGRRRWIDYSLPS